jgi:hypothetical protein
MYKGDDDDDNNNNNNNNTKFFRMTKSEQVWLWEKYIQGKEKRFIQTKKNSKKGGGDEIPRMGKKRNREGRVAPKKDGWIKNQYVLQWTDNR